MNPFITTNYHDKIKHLTKELQDKERVINILITKLTEVINKNSKHKEISLPTIQLNSLQKNLTNYCNQRGRENVFNTFNDFNIDGSNGWQFTKHRNYQPIQNVRNKKFSMPLQNQFNGLHNDDTIIKENNYDLYDKSIKNRLTHRNTFNRHKTF